VIPEQRQELGLEAHQLAQRVFVALDPGCDHPAGAVFDRGFLVRAERVGVPSKLEKVEIGERCRQIAELVLRWARGQVTCRAPVSALVYELPQVYRAGKSKGDPNGLIKLALVCGGVATGLGVPTLSPCPHDWIGNIKKTTKGDPWHSPRGNLIQCRLNALERTVVQPTHDAVDAAGLGLWALDRLARVYPGSS
jgi:hypothetical protein